MTKFIPIATEHEDARHTLYNINTSVAAAGDGSVWVTVADAPPVEGGVGSFANGRLIRIDAAAGQVVGAVDIGPDFVGDAALGDGGVWGATWGASGQNAVIRIDPANA